MRAKVLMVASGSGGTGKSTVAVFTAQALAQQGKRVLLIELAERLRSVDCIAGIVGQVVFDTSDWLAGRCTAERAMVQSPWCNDLFFIPAPYIESPLELSALGQRLEQLAKQFDFILLDTPTGDGPCFRQACAQSELALLVLTADLISLRSGRAMAEWIYANSAADVRLVLNRLLQAGQRPDLDECIDTVAAQLIAVVPHSKQVAQSLAQQQPLASRCDAGRAFANLAARICGQDVPLLFS